MVQGFCPCGLWYRSKGDVYQPWDFACIFTTRIWVNPDLRSMYLGDVIVCHHVEIDFADICCAIMSNCQFLHLKCQSQLHNWHTSVASESSHKQHTCSVPWKFPALQINTGDTWLHTDTWITIGAKQMVGEVHNHIPQLADCESNPHIPQATRVLILASTPFLAVQGHGGEEETGVW